ncbi:MAG: hypothetical protein ACLUE5_04800 [Dysosmobacter sp.]
MLQNGVDVKAVQEVLGHEHSTQRRSTRISTTRRCVLPQRQIPCHGEAAEEK